MGKPGFWDDQQRAASVSAEHRRATRKLESFRALESEVEDLGGPGRAGRRGRLDGDRARASSWRDVERRMDELEEQRLFQRPLRLRRRRRLGAQRRGRHGLAGLGRDAAADVPALGAAARLRRRDGRGLRGRGGGHQVGHLPRAGRERLRAVLGREGRAPARAAVAVRRRPPAPHELRAGRGEPAGRGRRRRRDRRERPADRDLPRLRRGRAAREQDRLGGADHAHPDEDRGPVPERALAVIQQADRDEAAEVEAGRAGGAPRAARSWRARRARPRTSPGARRSAPTSCTPTRW